MIPEGEMIVAVVGSRHGCDYGFFENQMRKHVSQEETLISGGAMGVDTYAEVYAKAHNIPFKKYLPRFQTGEDRRYDVRDYFERNRLMVNDADMVIAFWDGKSKGTKYTIGYARTQKVDVIIHEIGGC
ncbi:MAG: DUF2493 domain-containing protein [Candidatus Altiarchaeales archaeon]|nr:DUF2493 domain-containing protein [Candidatus Altiarchaeales archaeon]